jgi:hypothetical protein
METPGCQADRKDLKFPGEGISKNQESAGTIVKMR